MTRVEKRDIVPILIGIFLGLFIVSASCGMAPARKPEWVIEFDKRMGAR
jgi:hypothetical protein